MPVFLPALLLPVLFLAGCNRNRSAEYRAAGEREPAAVRVEAVRAVDNVYSDTYIGTVRASRSAVISCRHAGTLASLDVVQGQHVDKGDTIGTVSSQGSRYRHSCPRQRHLQRLHSRLWMTVQ